MRPQRLSVMASLAILFCVASPCLADDPNYTGGTIDSPGNTVNSGSYIQISGSFTKTFYGPAAERVVIKMTKMGDVAPTFLSTTCMTDGGFAKTTVKFDTDTLPTTPINQRPYVPSAGSYYIEVQAQKSDGMGGWLTLKTLTKSITAQ